MGRLERVVQALRSNKLGVQPTNTAGRTCGATSPSCVEPGWMAA